MPDISKLRAHAAAADATNRVCIPPRKELAQQALEINRLVENLRRDVVEVGDHPGYNETLRGDMTDLLATFSSLPVYALRAADGHYGPLSNRLTGEKVCPPQMALARVGELAFYFDDTLVDPQTFVVVATDGTELQLQFKQARAQWWSGGGGNEGFSGHDIWKASIVKSP